MIALWFWLGCSPLFVNNVVENRVIDRAVRVPDVGAVCAMGLSLEAPLSAATPSSRPPQRALLVAATVGALCAEPEVREAELDGLRARSLLGALGDGRAAWARDAALREQRAHRLAAARYARAWAEVRDVYGPLQGDCPQLAEDEEFVYLLGLFSGLMGLLHERRGGVEPRLIPDDSLSAVAHGATCLSDARWWYVPAAMQAAAGAVIPGAGRAGVDPWEVLDGAATQGDRSGVRLARALAVLLASNAGRAEVAREGIRAAARALDAHPVNPDWALLDAFAVEVITHESDLLWTAELGYRTPTLGHFPGENAGPRVDPFAADPFAP